MFALRRLRSFVVPVAVAGVVVATFVVVTGPTPASACSCAAEPLAAYAADVQLAFTGRQTDRTVEDEFEDNGAALTFDVDLVFKGEVGQTVTVRTHAQGSACGMDFGNVPVAGVAVFQWRGVPSVSLCGSSVSVEELAAVFGDGVAPIATVSDDPPQDEQSADRIDEDSSTWPLLVMVLGAVAALLVVSGMAVAGLRRR